MREDIIEEIKRLLWGRGYRENYHEIAEEIYEQTVDRLAYHAVVTYEEKE